MGSSVTRQEQKRAARKLALAEILEGMTQQALAEKVGTAPSYISNILTSARGCSDDMADRIEAAVGRVQGWMDIPRTPKKTLQVEQQHFREEQLDLLVKLTELPKDMHEAIVSSIESAHERLKPTKAKKGRAKAMA